MSTRARRTAAFVGIAVGLALPIRVPCGIPARQCYDVQVDDRLCTPTDVEPFGVYLAEWLVRRDLAIAYSSEPDCHDR